MPDHYYWIELTSTHHDQNHSEYESTLSRGFSGEAVTWIGLTDRQTGQIHYAIGNWINEFQKYTRKKMDTKKVWDICDDQVIKDLLYMHWFMIPMITE